MDTGIPVTNILAQIVEERRTDVARAQAQTSVATLKRMTEGREAHSLSAALTAKDRPNIIAEVKKASPSAGVFRDDFNPAKIAVRYQNGGAAAISVLTEPRHFHGCLEHLKAVRGVVSLPILRKDFICDRYQLHEAAAWGADAVLLIAAALDDDLVRDLYDAALNIGLEVLLEVHSSAELDVALRCEQAIIGVNSRDLTTLTTDLAVAMGLAEQIPVERSSVAESGIKGNPDILKLADLGYNGFLIGEALMRADNPETKLKHLLGLSP